MKKPGLAARMLISFVGGYQMLLSPVFLALGVQCRFHPSCSVFATDAIRKYGALRGGLRAIGRLLRCHPLHPGGFDPP